MKYNYKTKGTCSKEIEFEIENDIIKNVKFIGGCPGNLQAISKLVDNMNYYEVIKKLKGTKCGFKDTSCADQLCEAILSVKGEKHE